jgi:hypothetical protein
VYNPDPDPGPHPLADPARHHHRTDPAEVDGPGPEWYAELAETQGTPWPRGAHITRMSHTVGLALARTRLPECWPCPRCGGPKICPDLAATLPFRVCGYAPVTPAEPYGRWVHQ